MACPISRTRLSCICQHIPSVPQTQTDGVLLIIALVQLVPAAVAVAVHAPTPETVVFCTRLNVNSNCQTIKMPIVLYDWA